MRLTDIVVDEVSLVDKAANKRSFAFVKREGDKTEGETKPEGQTLAPEPKAEATPPAPAPAPAPAPVPAPEAQKPPTPEPTPTPDPDELDADEIKLVQDINEKINEIAASI